MREKIIKFGERQKYKWIFLLLMIMQASSLQALNLRGSFEDQLIYRRANRGSVFNPENSGLDISPGDNINEMRLALSDTIFESEGDISHKVAFYLKTFGYLQAQPITAAGEDKKYSRFRFDELYVDYELGEHIYLLSGKKRINWGVGFFANPVDAINPLKDMTDPAWNEEGTSLLLAEFNTSIFNISAVYSPKLDDKLNISSHRGGGQVSLLLTGWEFKLYHFQGEGINSMYGASLRSSWGNLVVYSEAATRVGSDRIYFDNQGKAFSKDGQQISGLAGISYSTLNNLSLTLEFYYDQQAYSAEERSNYFSALERASHGEEISATLEELSGEADKRLSQQYLGASISLMQWQEVWDFTVRSLITFDSLSALVNVSLVYYMTDSFSLGLEDQWAGGTGQSEYGNFIIQNEVKITGKLNF